MKKKLSTRARHKGPSTTVRAFNLYNGGSPDSPDLSAYPYTIISFHHAPFPSFILSTPGAAPHQERTDGTARQTKQKKNLFRLS